MENKKWQNSSWLLFLVLSSLVAVLLFDQVKVNYNVSKGVGDGISSAVAGDKIPDQYIVVLQDRVSRAPEKARILAKEHGLELLQIYEHALKGFAAVIPASRLEKIKADPDIKFIEQDSIVEPLQTSTQTSSTGYRRINAPNAVSKGAGVTVAVLDTGIDLDHPDLAGNIFGPGKNCTGHASPDDQHGHGTHVAGIIAALDNDIGVVGVASKARIISVKVMSTKIRHGKPVSSGTTSQLICGLDWVTANASLYNIKAANMSLGTKGKSDNNCGYSDNSALHQAVCRTRDAGVTMAAAAGNEGVDSRGIVPAAYDDAVITVSALEDRDGLPGGLAGSSDDTFAIWSNYGSMIDLGAPGVGIYSTYANGGYVSNSGTSMAAPHVAGAVVLYLSAHPGASWSEVRQALIQLGEPLGQGHTDPSGKHPEPVLQVGGL